MVSERTKDYDSMLQRNQHFEKWVAWEPSRTPQPADDLCTALAEGWEPVETLWKLLGTLESVINSEERFHVGESAGKLGFLQSLLASLTKGALGSSTMISPNFTKENLPEAYQVGYELSEDLQVHRAPEGGIYHFDFKRRLDRYLDGSQTETVTIATASWRHDIRGPSKRVRNLEEAEARIAELQSQLQSQFEQSQRELSDTQNELSMTKRDLSTTQEEFSAFRENCSRDNSTLASFLESGYRELWPGSIPTARSSRNVRSRSRLVVSRMKPAVDDTGADGR